MAVLKGSCCLELPSEKIKLTLAGGDVAVIARKEPFILCDNWRTPVRSIHEIGKRDNLEERRGLRYGGGGASTTLLTGPFFFEDAEDHALVAALPPVMHLRESDSNAARWLEGTLRFMNSELAESLPGSESIVNHLAHVIFVQAVRAHTASLPEESKGNLCRALFDPALAPAMGAMHLRLEEPWTVATLAEQASMSRSAFSARFTSTSGMSPLHYLTDCRMRKAKALLREDRMGLKAIAAKVGYSNESAFSSAFRRSSGMSPGAYRRQCTVTEALEEPSPPHPKFASRQKRGKTADANRAAEVADDHD